MPRGSRRLPDECLRLLAESDLILHAGDVVAASVLEELRAFAPVHAVHGNADEPGLKAALPETLVVEVEGARIAMIHEPGAAAGRAERLAARFPDCDAVVYGHTHQPEMTRHGSAWILNPGSPTARRRAPTRTMIVLDAENGGIEPRLVELT
jgi:putative phosphoesterase